MNTASMRATVTAYHGRFAVVVNREIVRKNMSRNAAETLADDMNRAVSQVEQKQPAGGAA